MSKVEICILQGPLEPLIDDRINRVRHALAVRILGDYAHEHIKGRGRGKRKVTILIARTTNEFWETHQVALKAAGFRNVWPDEDKGHQDRLVRLAKVAKVMDGTIPSNEPS